MGRACRFAVIPLVCVALIAGCGAMTTVLVRVDVGSFLGQIVHEIRVPVELQSDAVIYLLPGVQVEEAGTAPNEAMRAGLGVSVPVAPEGGEELLEQGRVELSVRGLVHVRNTHGSAGFDGVVIRLYLAGAGTTDVYEQGTGTVLYEPEPGSLGPGELRTIQIARTWRAGDPELEPLRSGEIRLGLRIDAAARDEGLGLEIDLAHLELGVSAYPFGMIP